MEKNIYREIWKKRNKLGEEIDFLKKSQRFEASEEIKKKKQKYNFYNNLLKGFNWLAKKWGDSDE